MSAPIDWLRRGERFPYDATDEWRRSASSTPAPPARDWAHQAARGVVSNLCDRRGIKQVLAGLDEEVRADLVRDLADIIHAAKPE
jgi:hypothetical protein